MIQGDAEWVNTLRDDLGLSEVGWIQPMATTGQVSGGGTIENDDQDDSDENPEGESPVLLESDDAVVLPGPPPDPERWLPKRERSNYRQRKKDKRAGMHM